MSKGRRPTARSLRLPDLWQGRRPSPSTLASSSSENLIVSHNFSHSHSHSYSHSLNSSTDGQPSSSASPGLLEGVGSVSTSTTLSSLSILPGILSANNNSVTAYGPYFHCNYSTGTNGEQSRPVTACATALPSFSRCTDNTIISALMSGPNAAATINSADPPTGYAGVTTRKAPVDRVALPTLPGDLHSAPGVDSHIASSRLGTTDETVTPLIDPPVELDGMPAGSASAVPATPSISLGTLHASGNRPHPPCAALRSGSAGTTPFRLCPHRTPLAGTHDSFTPT